MEIIIQTAHVTCLQYRLWDRRLPAAALVVPRAHNARIRGLTVVPAAASTPSKSAGNHPDVKLGIFRQENSPGITTFLAGSILVMPSLALADLAKLWSAWHLSVSGRSIAKGVAACQACMQEDIIEAQSGHS